MQYCATILLQCVAVDTGLRPHYFDVSFVSHSAVKIQPIKFEQCFLSTSAFIVFTVQRFTRSFLVVTNSFKFSVIFQNIICGEARVLAREKCHWNKPMRESALVWFKSLDSRLLDCSSFSISLLNARSNRIKTGRIVAAWLTSSCSLVVITKTWIVDYAKDFFASAVLSA